MFMNKSKFKKTENAVHCYILKKRYFQNQVVSFSNRHFMRHSIHFFKGRNRTKNNKDFALMPRYVISRNDMV